jgi:hypothetical protein
VHRMVSFRLPDAYVEPMLVMPASATETVLRRTGNVAHTKPSSASRRTKRCWTLFCNVKTTSTLEWIH